MRFLFDYMNKKYMLPRRGINKQWNPLLTYQLELGKLIDGKNCFNVTELYEKGGKHSDEI